MLWLSRGINFIFKPTNLSVIAIALLALLIRLIYIESSTKVSEVQYRSALIARGFYFSTQRDIPAWRIEVNQASLERLHQKEPSIMEFLASAGYLIIGREDMRLGRIFAAFFWMVGGIYLMYLVKEIVRLEAAIFSAIYYYFLPMGIHISLSFTADALMVMLFITSLYYMYRYFQRPSGRRLLIVSVVSGLCVLVKPLCMFALFASFLALALRGKSIKMFLNQRDIYIYYGICLVPVFLYYLTGIFVTQGLATQAQLSFMPHLWLQRDYWQGWFSTIVNRIGFLPLILGLLGWIVLEREKATTMMAGLWSGYFIFGLFFSYHIQYAGYYHSQLIVIIALSMGPFVHWLYSQFRKKGIAFRQWILLILIGMIIIVHNFREIRREFSWTTIDSAEVAAEIGELVNHSIRAAYLASYYGRPLEYLGELSGTYWPRADTAHLVQGTRERLSVEDRIQMLGYTPEFFIITDFGEFNRHHVDLGDYLHQHYHMLARTDQYLVYRLSATSDS
jgi:hypothetical protein